jgi:DNA repair protein RadC
MEQSIHHMEITERPRERLQLNGAAFLSDQELLAILLGSGNSQLNVLALSRNLLAGGLAVLAKKSFEELCTVKGIGPAKTTLILAAAELGRRAFLPEQQKVRIETEEEAIRYFAPVFRRSTDFVYVLVLLDRSKDLLASSELYLDENQLPDLQKTLAIIKDSGAHGFGLLRSPHENEANYQLPEKRLLANLEAAASMLRIRFYSRLIVPT